MAVLKKIVIFIGKHLCCILFLIKLQACNFEEHLRKAASEEYRERIQRLIRTQSNISCGTFYAKIATENLKLYSQKSCIIDV